MSIIRLLLILVTLLFILFQRVDVRVTKNERLTVKISLIFLALVLIEEKFKVRKIKPSHLFSGRAKGIYKSLKYLLANSEISFSNRNEPRDISNTSPSLIDFSFHFSLIRLIISSLIFLYYVVKRKVKRVIKNV